VLTQTAILWMAYSLRDPSVIPVKMPVSALGWAPPLEAYSSFVVSCGT